MIKVVNSKIETPIMLTEEFVSILIIENPHEYYRAVNQLICAMQGEQSEFTFWKNETQLSPAKIGEILLNGFSFELADKKIVTLLHKKLQSDYQDGSFILQFNEINTFVSKFLQNICQTVDFAIDYNELCLEDLLKVCSVKPAQNYDSLLEKIICYINIFSELKSVKFFVFVGLKDILSDDDLVQLYRHCILQKVSLFLLESSKKRPLLRQERAIIISDDLCEIVENYE